MSLYEASSLCLRSRQLLRDTLLRDDSNRSTASLPLPAAMALASPPATPIRRTLSPGPMSDYSPSRPRHMKPASESIPRRPHTATHTRDHSRSPLCPSHHLITPHEHVLRARLERVLFAAGAADDTTKRSDRDIERGRGRSPSAGPAASSLNGSTRTLKRIRASTDSNLPPLSPPSSSHFFRLAASSPASKHTSVSRSGSLARQKRRPNTGRSIGSASASGSASCSASACGNRSATGTTPPLVLDDGDHDEGRVDPRLLLLTPPTTPGYFQLPEWECNYRNTPHQDDDDDDNESCSSSCSSYREGSSFSSSALHPPLPHQHPLQLRTPTSLQFRSPPNSPHTPLRPFNARRASLQCRAIDGYVSFANVEGLGVPDDPPSPQTQDKGGKGVLTALGWGGGVVRKILGGGPEKVDDGPGSVVY